MFIIFWVSSGKVFFFFFQKKKGDWQTLINLDGSVDAHDEEPGGEEANRAC